MKSLIKWVGVVAVVGLLSSSAIAADTIVAGKVKSVDTADKKFVLTDSAGKDFTFNLGDNVVINRGGKEGDSGLKADDSISVCYDPGLRTWTADYILVKEGDTKDCQLVRGTFKDYDAAKKEFTFTDTQGKSWTNAMGDAKVRMNMRYSYIENVKAGDDVLAIVNQVGDKTTLKCVMARHGK